MLTTFFFVFTLISLVGGQTSCDNKICNHEAECLLKDFKPSCECIGKSFFSGDTCKERVDNCASNPCKSGASCRSQLGYFYCECPAGSAGQDCSVQGKVAFKNFHLHYNRLAVMGEVQIFLLMMEDLGDEVYSIELQTEEVFIEALKYGRLSADYKLGFKKSNDLGALAKSFGLRKSDNIPFQQGFYHVAKATFYRRGSNDITVSILDLEGSTVYVFNKYALQVYRPEALDCMPEVVVPLCNKPREPLQIDVAQYNVVEPVVKRHCEKNSNMVYKWSVKNYVGKVHLHDFEQTNSAILKISPYAMWFEGYSDAYFGLYQIYGEVEESAGDRSFKTGVRCYVKLDVKPVKSYIVGGPARSVGVTQSLILDGTKSRDFAFAPGGKQYLRYRWDCVTADGAEEVYCKKRMDGNSKFSIPAGELKLGSTYTYTLVVGSSENVNEIDRYSQIITVVDDKPLLVDIKCVRNCLRDIFVPSKIVHLKAVCLNCAKAGEAPTYAWTNNGKEIADQQRAVYTPAEEQESNIELTLTQGSRSGKMQLKLIKNTPPTGGTCKIEPATGNEYETEFEIKCENYEDENQPLLYEYITDEMTLERTGNPEVQVRLPKYDKLVVKICDSFEACTETTLAATITPMEVIKDVDALKILLQKKGCELSKLLKDGETEQAMILSDIVLKNAPSLAVAKLLMHQMNNFELETVLMIEQFTTITKHLLKPMQPLDNEKAALFSKFFAKLANGYGRVIRDGEINALLKDPYEMMTKDLSEMLHEFSMPLEDIPEVQIMQEMQDAGNPLFEQYPDFPKFDVTVLPRIENWLQAARQLNRCIQRLGIMAAYMHYPTEEPLLVEHDDLNMKVFAIEDNKDYEVTSKDEAANVSLNKAVVAELQAQLESKSLLLQVVSLKKNPFWWYPDEQPLNTQVFYFSAFSKKMPLNTNIDLQHSFDFSLKLQPTDNFDGATQENSKDTSSQSTLDSNDKKASVKSTTGFVETSIDMPLYEIAMPMNSVLIVKFIHSDIDLRVMLRSDRKPRTYMLPTAKDLVKAGETIISSLVLANNQCQQKVGYLAVMANTDVSKRSNFTFEMTLRECLTWDFSATDPQWSTMGCIAVQEGTTAESLRCRCRHLSSFAGKEFFTSARAVLGDHKLLEYMPINWYMVLFYSALALLCGLLLWCAQRRLRHYHSEHLIIEITDRDEVAYKNSDIKLIIHTGSKRNAGTTANIQLGMALRWNILKKFIIYQNPAEPMLTKNSSCTVRLPITSAELKHSPMRIVLQQDGAGRYPSWYCHAVEVIDTRLGQTTMFTVKQWIGTTPVQLEEELKHQTACAQFKTKLETLFINWFGFQAIAGPWRYGDEQFNRSDRTFVWIIKVGISLCIVACYFGQTTPQNYEEEREIYEHVGVDPKAVLLLSVICYLVCILVELVLKRFLLAK